VRVSKAPRSLTRLTIDDRAAILSRARVWAPVDTGALDLLRGPSDSGAFPHDARVTCDYVHPDGPLGGRSPKFLCALNSDDTVKVKYGLKNGETFAVVAGSRLLWALGFATHKQYPVQVECDDCPADPWPVSGEFWYKGRAPFAARRLFALATIERKMKGQSVGTPHYIGWTWQELDQVKEELGGAPRAHLDALKLLAVFIQHNDSKPEQQDLLCVDARVGKDESGNALCREARLIISDLGATFSEGSFWQVGKMDLEKWRAAPIWANPDACVGHLQRHINGNLDDPPISEAGRAFLASRLALLSDRQIADLFRAARVDKQQRTIREADGGTRPITVHDWVAAFKEKRDTIVNHRCPTAGSNVG
jgi:hypothetical protein